MKCSLGIYILFLVSTSYGQVKIEGPWTLELGASSNNAFQRSYCYNARYISPRFRWSEEYSEEAEKDPEKFKNMRLMLELIYNPPFKVLCTGFNAQYRMIRYKRLSIELYGGPKFFFVTSDQYLLPRSRAGNIGDIWYINMGLLCQLNLGYISPFVDFGGDRILTVGTEINFRKMYRKPKGRYKLRAKPAVNKRSNTN
jgi:hypothetical protein